MKVSVQPETLVFEGELDETSHVEPLLEALKELRANSRNDLLKLDFSKVKRSNSSGIVVWLRFLESADCAFEYINCPVWLINQFNMISLFLDRGSKVFSFQVPYFCEKTESCKNFNLEVSKDVPVLGDYQEFDFEDIHWQGNSYEPDVAAPSYLSFLAKISDRY